MKVLIYGFGWSGKAILDLCENMGCVCRVIDDALDSIMLDDERFMTYAMLEDKIVAGDSFDVYWIAVSGKPAIT
ncbi:MAG: hypothetical protein SOW07_00790, partial [Helicobacter sp.]|nr:hypothetical protein [Helicobacter sp.]